MYLRRTQAYMHNNKITIKYMHNNIDNTPRPNMHHTYTVHKHGCAHTDTHVAAAAAAAAAERTIEKPFRNTGCIFEPWEYSNYSNYSIYEPNYELCCVIQCGMLLLDHLISCYNDTRNARRITRTQTTTHLQHPPAAVAAAERTIEKPFRDAALHRLPFRADR